MRVLFFLIGLCFPFLLLAQNNVLAGKIKDATSSELLPGVIVLLDDSLGSTSDMQGAYSIKCSSGKHKVTFRLVGYASITEQISFSENERKNLDIALNTSTSELGTVVVSASRFEQKIEEASVSMEVISPSLIHNTNSTTLESTLDQVPGVTLTDGNASIRGGSGFSYGAGSRVLVLVDDLPMVAADAGDVKWNFLPLENLEQVEIIKGASSALFGSSALNGVINLRTAVPRTKPQSSVQFYSGMYDNPTNKEMKWWKNSNPVYQGATFSHLRKIGQLDLSASANLYSDEGYRLGEREQRIRTNIGTNYHFKKIPGLSAGVNVGNVYTRGGNFLVWANDSNGAYLPLGGLDTPSTTLSNYVTERTNIDPHISYISKNESTHKLRGRFFRSDNKNDSQQGSVADLYYGEYAFSRKFKNGYSLATGAGAMASVVKSDLYGNHRGKNYFAFAQGEKRIHERLILSFGIRGEYFEVDTSKTKENIYFIPQVFKDSISIAHRSSVKPVLRAGANYRLMKETYLRASFGEGYRFPTIAEKYISTHAGSLVIYPNDSVRPETGWSSEFGFRQGLKAGSFVGFLDAALFFTEYQNMMEFAFGKWDTSASAPLGGFGFKSRNVNDAVIKGLDVSVSGQGKIGQVNLTFLAGYTYMIPKLKHFVAATDTFTGTATYNVLKYRYRHLFKADIQAEYKKFALGVSFRSNSHMENIDRAFEIFPGVKHYRDTHPSGDYVFDGRIAFYPTEILKISFITKNIFNREYAGRPGDMQAPRSFVVQGDMKF